MRISVIIPMYNESSIIADTARTLDAYMKENFDDYEVLFFDDGSKDSSADIVNELKLPNIRVSTYGQNKGKGAAVRHAMLEADGDVLMFTDADLAYGTDVIKQAYEYFVKDSETDIVIGSRNIHKDGYEGYTFIRKLTSKVYIKVLCIIGGFKLTDSQCGCKAFSSKAGKKIFSKCEVNGFAFDFEAILWADKLGFKICEMPVKIINHRESKVNVLKDSIKMFRDLLKIKKNVKKKCKEIKK